MPVTSDGGYEHSDVYRLTVSAYLPIDNEALFYRFAYMRETDGEEFVLTDDQVSPVADGMYYRSLML